MSKILLFGGSFDPIHNGHLIVSRWAAERLGIERVILIPSMIPPHKQGKELTPAETRTELCRLATRGERGFEVCDWETKQSGPSFTLLTVKHFGETEPAGTELFWLIGRDSLIELPTWYHIGELASLCTLVTAGRPGWERPGRETFAGCLSDKQIDVLEAHYLDSPLIEISATEIRDRVRGGLSVRHLVPDAVAEAIEVHGLYRR